MRMSLISQFGNEKRMHKYDGNVDDKDNPDKKNAIMIKL